MSRLPVKQISAHLVKMMQNNSENNLALLLLGHPVLAAEFWIFVTSEKHVSPDSLSANLYFDIRAEMHVLLIKWYYWK